MNWDFPRACFLAGGGVFTYAAPMYAEGTAAGQVSARYLRHLYRVEKLTQGGQESTE